MSKVLLLGYFGAGNLGDDALLVDWLKRWQNELRATATTCDVCSSGAPLGSFLESAELNRLCNAVGRRELLTVHPRRYQALVLPGGSVLQNSTSTRSLLFYLWVIWRFTSKRVPVYMLGQGLGPLKGNMANNLSALVLSNVKLLALRDQRSYDWAIASITTPGQDGVMLAADPLLKGRLDVEPYSPYPETPFAVCIAKAAGSSEKDLDTQADAVINLMCDAQELGPKLIFAVLKGGSDGSLAEHVTRIEEQVYKSRGKTWSNKEQQRTSSTLVNAIASAEYVISYRLHGLIIAAAYGVPGLGVTYDPKVKAFCEEMGLPYCTPQDVLDGRANALVRELWHNRGQVKATMLERREVALSRLQAAEARFAQLMWGAA